MSMNLCNEELVAFQEVYEDDEDYQELFELYQEIFNSEVDEMSTKGFPIVFPSRKEASDINEESQASRKIDSTTSIKLWAPSVETNGRRKSNNIDEKIGLVNKKRFSAVKDVDDYEEKGRPVDMLSRRKSNREPSLALKKMKRTSMAENEELFSIPEDNHKIKISPFEIPPSRRKSTREHSLGLRAKKRASQRVNDLSSALQPVFEEFKSMDEETEATTVKKRTLIKGFNSQKTLPRIPTLSNAAEKKHDGKASSNNEDLAMDKVKSFRWYFIKNNVENVVARINATLLEKINRELIQRHENKEENGGEGGNPNIFAFSFPNKVISKFLRTIKK